MRGASDSHRTAGDTQLANGAGGGDEQLGAREARSKVGLTRARTCVSVGGASEGETLGSDVPSPTVAALSPPQRRSTARARSPLCRHANDPPPGPAHRHAPPTRICNW